MCPNFASMCLNFVSMCLYLVSMSPNFVSMSPNFVSMSPKFWLHAPMTLFWSACFLNPYKYLAAQVTARVEALYFQWDSSSQRKELHFHFAHLILE